MKEAYIRLPILHKEAMPGNGILEKAIRDQGQHTSCISFYTNKSFFEFLYLYFTYLKHQELAIPMISE